jgi:glucose/arabinose dehydrogenase
VRNGRRSLAIAATVSVLVVSLSAAGGAPPAAAQLPDPPDPGLPPIDVPIDLPIDLPLPGEALPPGFVVSTYARLPGLGTSLSFGPDTREGSDATRLYVLDNAGGRVLVIDDEGGVGGNPATFATGFNNPLGVLAAPNGVIYVADNHGPRSGPYGRRPYGRVWRVRDTDGDGVADKKQLLLKDLPNGRHNTNGMAIGPDGKLYITNGNSTDDGVEGGEPEQIPYSGSIVKVSRKLTRKSLAALPRRSTLVATGMRNIYDVAFSPLDETLLFTPMNGLDDARPAEEEGSGELEDSDDLLYSTDINDAKVDDMGFPSCLYNVGKQGDLKPYDNPNPATIKRFGRCPKARIKRPLSSFGAHPSSNGLAFQTTDAWGEEYKNNLFVAEFGNFFGDEVVGHDVIRVELDATGTRVVNQSEFFNAPLLLDLTFDAEGNLFVVSYDGTIYKIIKAA